MDPGHIPDIRPVTRYPGQGHVGADCKIPTEIYYDHAGNVRAIGAEARQTGIEDTAEQEGWTKAKWFKLHMRPRGPGSNAITDAIPPLPPKKTVVRVFADFLKYLYDCARSYIRESHAGGESLWDSVANNIAYVLSHPNGWEGSQQAQMRTAAILAGLIPSTDEGRARITFVTEGEASLNFCINNNLAPGALRNGEGIVIVDAGGGTVDVSAYKGQGNAFEETAIPQCHLQGSVFVTSRARVYISNLLEDTDFEEYVPNIVDQFDTGAKLMFKDRSLPQFIRFGVPRHTDTSLGIRNGQLKIAGPTLAEFFEPSISCIIRAVKDQVANSRHPISHVFLVGGFSASDWLYSEVTRALQPQGLQVSRPNSHVNKAVPDGAVAFAIDHYVGTRVSRAFFGVRTFVPYSPADPEHLRRQHNVVRHSITLAPSLEGIFSIVLSKNTQVSEAKEYRSSFYRVYKTLQEIESSAVLSLGVVRYNGNSNAPKWMDTDPENFPISCTVQANIRGIPREQRYNPFNGSYFSVGFDVVLLFGLTELKAQLAWKENGVEKRGPATIIFEPN